MTEKTLLEKVTAELTEVFGRQALIDFKNRFGDAAAERPAAVSYHIAALRHRNASFQESRNHG